MGAPKHTFDSAAGIKEKLKGIPGNPGVYLMKSASGEILYIGKAKNLKKRVLSYFRKRAGFNPKTDVLVPQINDIDFMATDSEVEALILEAALIKKHRPKYNIELKDDKSFPYIKITSYEDIPSVLITRRMYDKKADYFGPYTSGVRDLASAIEGVFGVKVLSEKRLPKARKNGKKETRDMEKSADKDIAARITISSPMMSVEEYRAAVSKIIQFLKQKNGIEQELEKNMLGCAKRREFEKAAVYRNRLIRVRNFKESQKIISKEDVNRDVIAFAQDEKTIAVHVFFIRSGIITGNARYFLDSKTKAGINGTLSAFLRAFYSKKHAAPKEIILEPGMGAMGVPEMERMGRTGRISGINGISGAELRVIEKWIEKTQRIKTRISAPKRGALAELVMMVKTNAKLSLDARNAETKRLEAGLLQLKDALGLSKIPQRIEGIDISNIRGQYSVGSVVSFFGGRPDKSGYRRFRIKAVFKQDDFSMMAEVAKRRYLRLLSENSPLPDLVLIDGGKGQLGAVFESLKTLGIAGKVPAAALAKKEEELYVPQKSNPVNIEKNSQGLFILMHVRDEAHRFAVSYHRGLRDKME